ncbi:MAG TPA: carboxypeptidase regulatory-like domain-containing protein [Blastocatellia bacterium]|nr:carboxypeptidase regulatory-like domain-containing protein [Blastocatellia bacterium]
MKLEHKRRLVSSTLRFFAVVFCLTFLVSVQSAFAQSSGSATLRGTVKDPSGAVVSGATVIVTSERTKDERKTITNDEGGYVFSALSPDTYTVKVEAQGFKTTEKTGIAVETSTTRGLDVVMEIGQASETVTVNAVADQVQTETGAKENTITAKQIDNLSIISRSSLELLRILPGVVAPDNTSLESISFGGGANANSQYHVNGLRGEQNTVTIDGSRMMDIGSNNGTIITANPDMVQEVKVQTSNYAAEHGTSAVQISATTKGGGHDFHGSIYDYLRDYHFQANDRSNSINGIKRPLSKYNYPGGNIGGPVIIPGTKFNKGRDKLFFFVGYEYYYQRVDEGSSLSVVPTLKQRQGDFSELLSGPGSNLNQGRTVNVPFGCTVNGVGAGNPAPNNNIAPCADPLGKALLNLYPAPNFTDPNNRYNYVYSVLRPNDRNQFTSRFDFNVSDRTKLYVRLAREYEEQGFPRGLWWDSSNYEIPGKLTGKNLGRSVVVNLTNIISPTMTNEVLFSASKLKLNYDFADPDKVTYAGLGLQPVGFFPGSNPYVPIGVIDAWGGGIGGNLFSAYGYPILAWNDSFAVTDNLTKVLSTHTMKFGMFIEQANKKQQSNHDTDITVAQWGQSNATGNNYGDLFVGRPIEFTQGTDRPEDHFRYYNYEFYGQDSFKVRPNFTLEYGLRLAYLPQNFERNGLGVLFDPTAYDHSQGIFINGDRSRPNGFKLAARDEIPKGVLPNNGIQWMPRLNFAWDIGGKGDWVIRAGAGIFYNRVQGNYDYYSSGQMPNTYSATVDTPWASSTGLTFSDLRNVDPFAAIANVNVSSRDINSNNIPRVANMSLTIEKRLWANNIFTVAYVGTQGRHLPQQRNINIVPLGALSSGTVNGVDLSNPVNRAGLDGSVIKQFRPFPAYGTVGVFQFTGTSTYHSLQATLSHQSGKNLQYFATYTFSKALGTVAVNESDGAAWADPIDTRGRSWGVLPFDRTHIFNLSYNYIFPKLARGALDHAIVRGFLDGWQMSGITTFQSGTPIRLRFTGDIASTGNAIAWYGSDAFNGSGAGASVGAVAPIYTGNPQTGGSGLGQKLFDINKLQIPAFANSGPAQPPFYMRTPSRSNFDVSFFKNFEFSESKKLQFRAGFFNLFNQAYPTQIATTGGLGASDIYLTLNTTCNVRVTVPNGAGGTSNPCDPTKGFTYTQETQDNFGKIVNKHGRRIVEFALKYYF